MMKSEGQITNTVDEYDLSFLSKAEQKFARDMGRQIVSGYGNELIRAGAINPPSRQNPC
jgi:hypothetical protein